MREFMPPRFGGAITAHKGIKMSDITLKQSTIPAFKDFQLLDSNIRTTVINGNIFFRAVDVCKAFKLGDVKDEVNKLRLRIAMTNQAVENMQEDVGGKFPPTSLPMVGLKKSSNVLAVVPRQQKPIT